MKNLLNDYEIYRKREEELMEMLEQKLSEIPYIDKLLEFFIDHDNSVWFFQDSFYPVTFPSAEQIEGIVNLHGELVLNDCTQSVNGFAHIGSSTDDINSIDI